VDGSGSAYIAGITASGFPVKSNALQKYFGGGKQDGFVAKLNASGTSLLGSTYVGGSGNDAIYGLALDQYRQVYVTGYTNSPNFPLQASLQSNDNSTGQIFVTTLMSTLSSIAYYSTLFGTHLNFPSIDYPVRIAVDKALNVYLAGEPLAIVGSFPTTPGAVHIPAATNLKSIFVSKFVIMDDLALGISASSGSVLQGNNLTYTIAVTSKGPDFAYNLRVDDPVPAGTTFVSYGAGGGTCTAPEVGGTGNLHCVLPQLRKGDTYAVTLTVNVTAVSGATLSNTATTVSNMQDFVQDNNKGTLTTKVN
jgi:uncharacterized repeat protein (TIGR01451 family)